MYMYFHVVEILLIIHIFVSCFILNGLIKVKAFKELLMNILYNFMISQTIDTAQDYFFNIFIIYKVFFLFFTENYSLMSFLKLEI